IEGDWTWLKTRYSFCRQTDTGSLPCTDNGDGFVNVGSKLDWMATARGRVGVVVNDVLVYGTGGVAVGAFKTTLEQSCLVFGCGASSIVTLDQSATFTDQRVGWVAGGGLEYLWAQRWLVRAEYLHADFGTLTNSFATSGSTGAQTAVWSRKETLDLV